MRRLSWLIVIFPFTASAATSVKVSIIEALAPRDTTSSERFQKEFESAAELGRQKLSKRLRSCGYELETETAFYAASDPLQARERGLAAAEKGAWLIVGPRRSNHYLLLAQAVPELPTVSLMASSTEVDQLGPRHVSLSPSNSSMALEAAREVKLRLRKGRAAKFISIVSADCAACVDFHEEFVSQAKGLNLTEQESVSVSGEAPDLVAHLNRIQTENPDFVLLPNYSKVSSHIMSRLVSVLPKAIFVGGDGWGDASFGFVNQQKSTNQVVGFTVRGFPPVGEALKTFALGASIGGRDGEVPLTGAPSLGILKAFDGLANILCSKRPKSRAEFANAFETQAKAFRSPWGVSVYDLKDGQIQFTKRVGIR